MSLRELVQANVTTAFKELGDLKSSGTYTSSGGTYDPSTGTVSTGTTYSFTDGVVTVYGSMEIDNTTVLRTDRKLILNATGLGFNPAISGTVTINSSDFKVVSVRSDPAGATYTLQLRL